MCVQESGPLNRWLICSTVSVHTGSGLCLHLHNSAMWHAHCLIPMLNWFLRRISHWLCRNWLNQLGYSPLSAQWMVPLPSPNSRLRKALSIMSTTYGPPCWNLCVTLRLACLLEALLDEKEIGRVALSCHFSLGMLCHKTSFYQW